MHWKAESEPLDLQEVPGRLETLKSVCSTYFSWTKLVSSVGILVQTRQHVSLAEVFPPTRLQANKVQQGRGTTEEEDWSRDVGAGVF